MNKSGKLRTTKAMHLLGGKVICGICGAVMQGTIQHRKNKEPFRTALQSYIHSITVYRYCVDIRLFVNGEVRKKAFQTPTQRAFKN